MVWVQKIHEVDMSCNLGCKHTRTDISYCPPPHLPLEPPVEQPCINGFQVLEAGDGVMIVMLYHPLRARCESTAVRP